MKLKLFTKKEKEAVKDLVRITKNRIIRRLRKNSIIYNYLIVPDNCFKSESKRLSLK